jgi:hypothetical protein
MARPLPPGAPASGSLAVRFIHPMIALVALIGVGSFLFHTAATRWAQLADVLPIGAFILLYLIFALRCMAGLSGVKVMLGLAALIAAFAASMAFCPSAMSGGSGRAACLNDTLGYAPALAALFAVAVLLRRRSHPAAGRLLLAAAVLLLSMVMRTIDLDQCSVLTLEGRALGSHFLWHSTGTKVLGMAWAASRLPTMKTSSSGPACKVASAATTGWPLGCCSLVRGWTMRNLMPSNPSYLVVATTVPMTRASCI